MKSLKVSAITFEPTGKEIVRVLNTSLSFSSWLQNISTQQRKLQEKKEIHIFYYLIKLLQNWELFRSLCVSQWSFGFWETVHHLPWTHIGVRCESNMHPTIFWSIDNFCAALILIRQYTRHHKGVTTLLNIPKSVTDICIRNDVFIVSVSFVSQLFKN